MPDKETRRFEEQIARHEKRLRQYGWCFFWLGVAMVLGLWWGSVQVAKAKEWGLVIYFLLMAHIMAYQLGRMWVLLLRQER